MKWFLFCTLAMTPFGHALMAAQVDGPAVSKPMIQQRDTRDDDLKRCSDFINTFGQPHIRLGGVIGFSAGVTLSPIEITNLIDSNITLDAGRGGMKVAFGGYAPVLGLPWPGQWGWKPIGGVRVTYVQGWNDRDESELPPHIVGKIQARGYWGVESVLCLGRIGPAVEIGAYRAISDPHENIIAVGYGFGY